MNLHTSVDLFKDAIQATAKNFSISEFLIEKDYWITRVLKSLSKSNDKEIVIFKGGTSLSKAYKILNRFSEDIDLAIIDSESLSDRQRKTLLKNIEKSIVEKPLERIEAHPLTSKGSKYRKTAYQYPQVSEYPMGQAKDAVILEINTFTTAKPFEKKKISSFISEFLEAQDKNLVEQYGLEPFELFVLSKNRTLIEKIFSLVRFSYESTESYGQLKEKIRHFYDVAVLCNDPQVKKFIESPDFETMINTVKKDDARNPQFKGEWLQYDLTQAPLFQNTKSIMKGIAKDFSKFIEEFVYKDPFPLESCENAIRRLAKRFHR